MIEIVEKKSRKRRKSGSANNITMLDIPLKDGKFYKFNKSCSSEFRRMVFEKEREVEIRNKLEIEN